MRTSIFHVTIYVYEVYKQMLPDPLLTIGGDASALLPCWIREFAPHACMCMEAAVYS